jgi:hypothetical protein
VWVNSLVVRGSVQADLNPFLLRNDMTIGQGFSLRRQMMRHNAKGQYFSNETLGLGTEEGQRNYSAEIERKVGVLLTGLGISYKTETDMKGQFSPGGTPDSCSKDRFRSTARQ